MTVADPLPSSPVSETPEKPEYEKRPPSDRYYRVKLGPRLRLTRRDEAFLCDLFTLRVLKTQAAFLSALAHTDPIPPVKGKNAPKQKETGLANFHDRLKSLFQSGYIWRFEPRRSRYMAGSKFKTLLVDDGKANQFALTSRHKDELTPEERAEVLAKAAPVRERVIETFAEMGWEAGTVEKILKNNSEMAEEIVFWDRDYSHFTLIGTVMSVALFGMRRRGLSEDHLYPDGSIDFGFDEWVLDKNKHHVLSEKGEKKTKHVGIEPDFTFSINRDVYALEAETGTSARWKVQAKVRNYLKFWRQEGITRVRAELSDQDVRSFRVWFHCSSKAHARMVLDVISEEAPKGTGLFLVTSAADIHLGDETTGERWSLAHFTKNLEVNIPPIDARGVDEYEKDRDGNPTDKLIRKADPEIAKWNAERRGTPLHDFLADRIASPIFEQVTGRIGNTAQTKFVSLI